MHCVLTIPCFRWTRPGGEHEYACLIPEISKEPANDSQGHDDATVTNKGALYYRYSFQVHSFLALLRRAHPQLPAIMLQVAKDGLSSSESGGCFGATWETSLLPS